jgi:hypothetical protein
MRARGAETQTIREFHPHELVTNPLTLQDLTAMNAVAPSYGVRLWRETSLLSADLPYKYVAM